MTDKVPIREGIFQEDPNGDRLLAGTCDTCGQVYFPRISSCFACGHETVIETALSSQGKLYSYSVVQMPTSKFTPPYAVGYVDFAEGVRVFGQLDMIEGKPFQIGMEMAVYIGKLWQEDDKEIIGYRFSPVQS
jgi:uncharacterized protein